MRAKIVDITDDAVLAFPARVVGDLIPEWPDIPSEYRRDDHPYAQAAKQLFFGKNTGLDLVPREGINPVHAYRMIRAVLSSFEPRHQHKIAGVAYLIDSFFEAPQ